MRPCRILVVADDEHTQLRIADALRATGASLARTTSLTSFNVLRGYDPALVIVDLGTAGYEGDTAWRVRRMMDDVYPEERPTVAVTGLAPSETLSRARRIDALKTFERSDLPALVEFIAARTSSSRAAV